VQRFAPEFSFQRDFDGTPMVTDMMRDETCLELAKLLGDRNEGIIQIALRTSRNDPTRDRMHVEALAEASRRPIIWNALLARAGAPMHRGTIAWLRACTERGLRIYGHTMTGEVAHYFTFEDWNEWDDSEAWREATIGSVEERLAKLSDPAMRTAIKDKPTMRAATGQHRTATGRLEDVVLLHTEAAASKQYENLTIGDISQATGKHPVDVICDLAVEDNLKALFYWEVFAASSARGYQKEVVDYEFGIPGMSDGGAHTKFLTGGRYSTEYLSKWVRDLAWVSLEDAHWRLSAYPAFCGGFRDRGVIREGAAADIVVYDYANLEILPPEVAFDVPGQEWRRVQRAKGYRYVLVNGEVTIEDDKETSNTPGQLLRHGRGARPEAAVARA
jgi:N-acyl-D-aspartate/D-glutamate deacylase